MLTSLPRADVDRNPANLQRLFFTAKHLSATFEAYPDAVFRDHLEVTVNMVRPCTAWRVPAKTRSRSVGETISSSFGSVEIASNGLSNTG